MSDFLTSTARVHLQREEAIGATKRIVDLSQGSPNGSTAPRPVVSLKTLFSDFEVRELPAFYGGGAPLQLDLTANGSSDTSGVGETPKPEARKESSTEALEGAKRQRDSQNKAAAPPAYAATAVTATIGPLVSAEDLAALLAGLAEDVKAVPLPSVVEKEKRTQLHAAIKACLGTTHVSNTVDGAVCVVKANAADRREERRRSRVARPPPSFLHFTLYKENTDSNQALRMIAAHLRVSQRQLQFCGTKDKRAVTLQRVAVRDTAVERLQTINDRSFGQHNVVKVCSFTQESHGLKLGDAKGNHFRIALRVFPAATVGAAPAKVDAALLTADYLEEVQKVVRAAGVINYFGPQRFGTTSVLTSDVGVQFLQGHIAEGLRLLLASKATIVPELTRSVELFDARNYEDALQAAPYFCYQERDVLQHLCTNPNDFLGALQAMPRTMAMLYFHAVQSLVWNRVASARLSGADRVRAEVGDLVLETTYQARLKGVEEGSSTVDGAADDGDGGETPAVDTDAKLAAVHRLSSDEECARFTLADVVLPVPGPDQDLVYPNSAGCTRADYAVVLQTLGVDFQSKDALSLRKIFHFHGTYRALGVRPRDFELRLHTAPSWRAPVLHSDWEVYCTENAIARAAGAVTEEVAASEPQGAIAVVVASFSLPPGCYATSVLREFCIPSTEGYHSTEAAAAE